MGRYVPPDLEGVATGNSLHGTSSRRKPGAGQVVRFEMPFAIWCTSCSRPTIIGQGVRFNAEKRRAGSYFSTPIWSFTMRHVDCGGEIEIRTDPKNTAYIVERGARRRETAEDEAKEGDLVVASAEEREKLRQNAFAGLEKTIEDREQLKAATSRLTDLEDASYRDWDDPYSQNQILRKTFRKERKRLEKESAAAEDVKDRMGLSIDLLPFNDMDAVRASLVEFGSTDDAEPPNRAMAKPLFAPKQGGKQKLAASQSVQDKARSAKKLKSEAIASRRKEILVSEIIGNTRAARRDPFLDGAKVFEPSPTPRLAGVKRKKSLTEEDTARASPSEKEVSTAEALALVNYDSE